MFSSEVVVPKRKMTNLDVEFIIVLVLLPSRSVSGLSGHCELVAKLRTRTDSTSETCTFEGYTPSKFEDVRSSKVTCLKCAEHQLIGPKILINALVFRCTRKCNGILTFPLIGVLLDISIHLSSHRSDLIIKRSLFRSLLSVFLRHFLLSDREFLRLGSELFVVRHFLLSRTSTRRTEDTQSTANRAITMEN